MNGKEIFKFAVKVFPESVDNVLSQQNITADDIDLFIPHQANIRIILNCLKMKLFSNSPFTMSD